MVESEEDKAGGEAEGAEGEGGAAPAEGADPLLDEGGGKKKIIIIAAAAAVLLVGGGAGAYFMGLLDGLLGKGGETQEAGHDGAAGKDGAGATTVFLPIPEMRVNLTSEGSTPRYLRLIVQLELKNDLDKQRVEAVMPRVIDQFQTYLRELRPSDLHGSMGLFRLKEELTRRANAAVSPGQINAVLFKEIVVQ